MLELLPNQDQCNFLHPDRSPKLKNLILSCCHQKLLSLPLSSCCCCAHISELKQEAQKYLNKVREKTDENMANNNDKKIPLRTELIGSASAVGGIVGFAEKENVD